MHDGNGLPSAALARLSSASPSSVRRASYVSPTIAADSTLARLLTRPTSHIGTTTAIACRKAGEPSSAQQPRCAEGSWKAGA